MYKNLLPVFSCIILLSLFTTNTSLTAPASTLSDKDKLAVLDSDPNLVGWWKLDEESGKIAADSSKHKRKGELKGDFSFETD
ncbi:MAG: hypothetical protein ACYSWS_09975 [Planctomycetota bacterium]